MADRNMQRIEINIHEKELCVKLVIYKDYTEMHGQQNIKYFTRCTNRIRFIKEKAVFGAALYGCKTWRKQGLAMGRPLARASPDQCVGHICL